LFEVKSRGEALGGHLGIAELKEGMGYEITVGMIMSVSTGNLPEFAGTPRFTVEVRTGPG
jgi:hypothetical protein